MITEMLKEKRENEKKIVLRDVPYSMSIETSAYCNLRCVMCENPTMKRKKGNMDLNVFKKIADEVGKYSNIKVYLSGYGEPLLNEKIVDIVQYATNAGITQTFMNSNAMLLDEEKALGLIKAGLHSLIVSIDGFNKETYESIRVGADRDVVYKNVTRYLELLKEHGTENQIVEVQLIEMDGTMPEEEEWIAYWRSKGANIKIKSLIEWGTDELFESRDNKSVDVERLACDFCNELQIMWNGDVPVCNIGEVEVHSVIGNVRDMGIKELWEKKKQIFSNYHINHEFDKLPDFCKACENWRATFAKRIEGNRG